jgi:hypothetical protein
MTTTYESTLDLIRGLDTENSPPCQVLVPPDGERACGKPSCKRIFCRCRCGKTQYMFMCRSCDELIGTFGGACHFCGSSEFTMSPA